MKKLADLRLPNPFEGLVPFALVFGAVSDGVEPRELGERAMAPDPVGACLVMSETAKGAPRQFLGWTAVSDRIVPVPVYTNTYLLFLEMARAARGKERVVVPLEGMDAGQVRWPEQGALIAFAWPLVARFQVPAGRPVPCAWSLGKEARVVLEELLVRKLNLPPAQLLACGVVAHRAIVPALLDAQVAWALEKLGPEAVAAAERVPRPLPEQSYDLAAWPVFLPECALLLPEGRAGVVLQGNTEAVREARRKLQDAGWPVRG